MLKLFGSNTSSSPGNRTSNSFCKNRKVNKNTDKKENKALHLKRYQEAKATTTANITVFKVLKATNVIVQSSERQKYK